MSPADLRQWIPAAPHLVDDLLAIPEGTASGVYVLEVAILDEAGRRPYVSLAIDGKRPDGWYAVSTVEVRR